MSSSSSEEFGDIDQDEAEKIFASESMKEVRQRFRDSLAKLPKEDQWGVIECYCSSNWKVDVQPQQRISLDDNVCGFRLSFRIDNTTTVKNLLEMFKSSVEGFNRRCSPPLEWDTRSIMDMGKTHKLMHNDTTDLLEHPNATLNLLGVKSGDTVFIRHKSALTPFTIKIKIKGGPNKEADEDDAKVVLMPEDTPRDVKEKLQIQAGLKSTENYCLCIVSQNIHFKMMSFKQIAAYGFLKHPQQKEEKDEKKPPNADDESYLCTENKMYLCFNNGLHKRETEVSPVLCELLGKKQPSESTKALGILLPTTVQLKPQIGEVVAVGEERDIGKNIVEFTTEEKIFSASATGEEIKNKCLMKEYLCANPGSPSLSELDRGSGETPRLSTIISKKKAIETPEGEKLKKRKKSGQGNINSGKSKSDISEAEVDASTVEGSVSIDVAMKGADNVRLIPIKELRRSRSCSSILQGCAIFEL